MLGFRKIYIYRIFILFLFTSLLTLQKWSGKDPGNYKSIKGRLSSVHKVYNVHVHGFLEVVQLSWTFKMEGAYI